MEITVENENSIQYRAVIFKDYQDLIAKKEKTKMEFIGAFIPLTFERIPLAIKREGIIPLAVMYEKDTIYVPNIDLWYVPLMLEAWYGIQIALLHPIVKYVFENPRRVKNQDYRKAKTSTLRKNIVKYIKYHSINVEEIEEAIYGKVNCIDGKRKLNRRALVWYVVGHWRTYKNGKKIFVQPYWKGALKELKKAIPDRERQIAQIT